MRLAVIADVHGNLVALEAVLAHIARQAPDAIINLGDCVTAPLWPNETLQLLDSLEIPCVRGNHDRWLTEPPPGALTSTEIFTRDSLSSGQIEALYRLPAVLRVDADVTAVHGTPANDTDPLLEELWDGRLARVTHQVLAERLRGTAPGLVLCGHTHLQHVVTAPGGWTVVNPGSVGCPRYADNDQPWIAEAGSPHARCAIATRGTTGWTVETFALAYDWSPVVQRALENGRPDWATAFLGESRGDG